MNDNTLEQAKQQTETQPQALSPDAFYTGETVLARDVSFAEYLKRYVKKDEGKIEWLTGTVIQHMSASTTHERIVAFLIQLLGLYLGFRFGADARVYGSNTSMYINDQQPAREPDILVVLAANFERVKETYLHGPADFVVEVVSPESTQRDRGTKVEEYEAAGVTEYWIIDPKRHEILAYHLQEAGAYKALPRDANGATLSHLFTGFKLHPDTLAQETLLYGAQLVQMAQAMANTQQSGA
jgi:Uma2 family endonuclease